MNAIAVCFNAYIVVALIGLAVVGVIVGIVVGVVLSKKKKTPL